MVRESDVFSNIIHIQRNLNVFDSIQWKCQWNSIHSIYTVRHAKIHAHQKWSAIYQLIVILRNGHFHICRIIAMQHIFIHSNFSTHKCELIIYLNFKQVYSIANSINKTTTTNQQQSLERVISSVSINFQPLISTTPSKNKNNYTNTEYHTLHIPIIYRIFISKQFRNSDWISTCTISFSDFSKKNKKVFLMCIQINNFIRYCVHILM